MAKNTKLAKVEPKHDAPYDGDEQPNERDVDAAKAFNIALIYHPLSKYTVNEKVGAVGHFMHTGNMVQTAKATGIPRKTLDTWKNHSCWWEDTLEKCRKFKNDELDAELSDVIHKTSQEIIKRVQDGNPVKVKRIKYMAKDEKGNVCEVVEDVFEERPMNAKDLSVVLGITYDKRALMRGEATSRADNLGQGTGQASLDQVLDAFKQISKDALQNKIVNSIPGEATVINGDK